MSTWDVDSLINLVSVKPGLMMLILIFLFISSLAIVKRAVSIADFEAEYAIRPPFMFVTAEVDKETIDPPLFNMCFLMRYCKTKNCEMQLILKFSYNCDSVVRKLLSTVITPLHSTTADICSTLFDTVLQNESIFDDEDRSSFRNSSLV